MNRLLDVYHRLPPPMRSTVATARGAVLRFWRHGEGAEAAAQLALVRDTWTPEQWREWHDGRLAQLLHRAATRVPWYRALWESRRQRGDRAAWDVLQNWPVLEKEELRRNPRAFVADDRDPRRMFHEQTSGTTGTPLEIWRTRATVQALYGLSDARIHAWHGVPRYARWARLGGQLVTPLHQRKPPFWVWNAAMRQLYMSTFHLAPDLIPYYLDALRDYRIAYIAGYPSSLAALARAALRLGRRDLRMHVALTNAEPLTADQRRDIESAFQCKVRDSYGMAETVAAASECPDGRMHVWPEVGIIEVRDGECAVPAGESGELICTGLLNPDMPLIRYRTGDSGCVAPDAIHCPCGRTLPILDSIHGRHNDLLVTRDGRRIFWLNPVFYGMPVRESQIVQETLDRIRVRVVPTDGFDATSASTIEERLRDRLGEVAVLIEMVSAVPRTAAGKLRPVVCHVSAPAGAPHTEGAGGAAGHP